MNKSRTTRYSLFFFQAEDGIRDIGVTGVQTCALPIWRCCSPAPTPGSWSRADDSRRDRGSGLRRPLSAQEHPVDMKLELVPVPVADVDRAKAFYVDRLGFTEDVDVRPADGVRVVQVTPPGSACSIGFGTGVPAYDDAAPGTVRGLHLV